MADPIARSPIRPLAPVAAAGWEVTGRQSTSDLTLTDLSPVAKIGVRAAAGGRMARALGVLLGRAVRDSYGTLVIGSGPGEWLVLGLLGETATLRYRLAELASSEAADELTTVIDLTHGRALIRLTGVRAASVLAKVCGIDVSSDSTPNGAAFRSLVAKLVTDVIRDDQESASGPVPSYLLHCERSYGQYLFDALLNAGEEFGIDVGAFRTPGI